MTPKTIPFSHFAKRKLIKKHVLLQPPSWPNIGVFQLVFFKPKTLMLNKKHNLKQEKAKIRKRDVKEKTRQETPQKKGLMKINFVIEYFDVVPFMNKSKQRRQKKRRDKNKEPKENTKERQEGRKKEKNKRETAKEKMKKGEAQKGLRRNKGSHSKINKKWPFQGGKQVSSIISKEREGNKKNKQIKPSKRTKKHQNTKKELFNYQSIFWWVSKISLLWQLRQKGALPKNRGFGKAFFEKEICVTKWPFLDQKPNPWILVIIFCLFSSLATTKIYKLAETPIR